MTDPNTPTIKIDSLIQSIEAKFQAIKSVKYPELVELDSKLAAAKTSTKNLKEKIEAEITDTQALADLNIVLQKIIDIQTSGQLIVKDDIEKLAKDIKNLDSTAFKDWLNNINKMLEGLQTVDVKSELNLRLDKLIQETKPKVSIKDGLSQEVQEELAKLIILAGKAQVELKKYPPITSNRIAEVKSVVEYLEFGIASLTDEPYLYLARKLQFESKSRLRGRWFQFLNIGDMFYYDVKVPTKVVVGVILSFPISLLINGITQVTPIKGTIESLLPRPSVSSTPSPSSKSLETTSTADFIFLIFMTGTLGGVISILYRLKDFDDTKTQKYDDAFLPYLIGIIKPIVGGSFAFFVFVLLNSGVSPLTVKNQEDTKSDTYSFLALAFIAGFSERFALNLIDNTVDSSTGKVQATPKVTGLPPTTPTLTIDPPTVSLNYRDSKKFTLSNAGLSGDNYDITLTPKIGECKKDTKSPTFVYTAPEKKDASTENPVTITVTTKIEPIQTATATVTLT
jgi:hypothetical protein